jgi:hypothetical protein
MLPLGALLWWRRRTTPEHATLLLLALLLLLRCMLDTWDTAYYMLPFLLALTAWESRGGTRGLPALALASTALAWLDFEWLPTHASADAQAAVFVAWTLPLAAGLALTLYAPGALDALARSTRTSAQALTRRRSAPSAVR